VLNISNSAGPASSLLKYLLITAVVILLMYFGKGLFVPLFYGLLIAMVMYAICAWLEARRWSRSIAILLCLTIITSLFAALLALLGWQISLFRQDWPELVDKMRPLIPRIQQWLLERFSISLDMQQEWLQRTAMTMSGNAGQVLQTTLQATAVTLFQSLLI